MRIVVLVSGSGSNLQAVIDAAQSGDLPVEIAAVGSDKPEAYGLERARSAGIETFTVPLQKGATPEQRQEWNRRLGEAVLSFEPDVLVSSGFMRIVSAEFLDTLVRTDGQAVPMINTHPALLPSFPGAHAVRDALAHGVKVTGCTVHQVDSGVDTGPILAQTAVEVLPGDDEPTLHERIKTAERDLLNRVLAETARGEHTFS
ncbi:phosphoribosylglycinamide formyltransferase [Nesterenkonia populi]